VEKYWLHFCRQLLVLEANAKKNNISSVESYNKLCIFVVI
jgi:hypothetical protein